MNNMLRLDISNLNSEETKRFNEIIRSIADEYTEFVDSLSKGKGDNLFWWSTNFASRNILLSTCQKQITKLLLAIEEKKKNSQIQSVFVENPNVGCALKKYFQENNIKCDVIYKSKKRFPTFWDAFLCVSRYIIKEVRQAKSIKRIRGKNVKREEKACDEFTIIQTDVFSSCFETGKYRGRDFVDIEQYVDSRFAIYPYLHLNTDNSIDQLIESCINDKTTFVFREDYLKYHDYLKLYALYFKYKHLVKNKVYFKNFDVTDIVKNDILCSALSQCSFVGILDYYAVRRMAKKGVKIRSAIGWYEGQPSSIAFFMAIRRYFEGINSVGYVGYPIDESWIQCAPTKEQCKQGVLPKTFAVCGEYYKNHIRRYKPSINVDIAPAFRLQNLYKTKYSEKKQKKILVALPYFVNEARNMLTILNDSEIDNYEGMVIRNHPTKRGMGLIDYGIDSFKHKCVFEDEGTMGEALSKYELIVMSAASTAVLEGIVMGAKIILIMPCSETPDSGVPSEWEDIYYYEAYDSEDVSRTIKAIKEKFDESFERPNWEHYVAKATRENVEWMFNE